MLLMRDHTQPVIGLGNVLQLNLLVFADCARRHYGD